MRRRRWLSSWVALSVGVGCCTWVVAQGEPKKKAAGKRQSVTGQVTSVDEAAKSFKVKGRKGEKTVKTSDKTRYSRQEAAQLGDVANGKRIKVIGKVAEDKKSVEAKTIILVAQERKTRGKGITKTGVTGTAVREDDNLSVKTSDGTTVAIKTSAATTVYTDLKASLADVKVGKYVAVEGSAEGDAIAATGVVIRTEKPKKPKGPKAVG